MWFTPLGDRDTARLMTRVMNIIDVVAACRDAGYDWLEQLMENVKLFCDCYEHFFLYFIFWNFCAEISHCSIIYSVYFL